MKKYEINTERLLLTPHGTKYLESTYEYTSDLENTKYMVFLPNDCIDDAREYLEKVDREWEKERPELIEFAIIYDGVQVGSVGLSFNEEYTSAELGWCLNKKYWGKGIMSEAALAAVEFGVKEFGIKHYIAHCDGENVASYKVMEKIGMSFKESYGGRKNKSSDEDRTEFLYEMFV